jgi:GH35 family endo-1,4-beta-xylanase
LVAGEAAAEPIRIGTSFSDRQCRYLHVNAKKTLKEILRTKFDLIRLAAYWDELEPQDGVYDFSSLDWQIAQTASAQIPIVLTVGMKAPRWPEYFIPPWLLKELRLPKGSDVSRHAKLRQRTLRFIQAVVERYRDEEMIRYWQVENEPLDRTGPGYWWISPSFVKEEVELVRRLDLQRRPIVMTTVTYPNPLLRRFMYLFMRHDTIDEAFRLGDILGVNVYPVVGHRWFFKRSYYWTTPEQRKSYLSSILKRSSRDGKPVWVTELQAEPWEPDQLVYIRQEPPPTGDPAIAQQSLEELRALGIKTVLLWGAEYWQFRKTRHRDPQWWGVVQMLLHQEQAVPVR